MKENMFSFILLIAIYQDCFHVMFLSRRFKLLYNILIPTVLLGRLLGKYHLPELMINSSK